MDILTLIGVTLAFIAIVGGNALEGGHFDSLVQGTAFIIVFGGTLGAIMIQTPLATFFHALKIIKWIFVTPTQDAANTISNIMEWSQMSRREGLLSLQSLIDQEKDPFIQQTLTLLVDGNEPEAIRRIMEVKIASEESFDSLAAKVYEGLGGYSPTIGIIGAVMGLIHVMNNLADPSKLGPGIAVAFVATIYGVGLANLFFLPTASKLKAIIAEKAMYQEMLIDGIVCIAEGENPRNIETKLQGYLK
ncbi:MAG TPA: flagellar motor protein [Porticoccaceae bacterium]|nr:flagellar motor protein [Porticoccaceae bacterium]HCO59976.1 flagellar motor protein [Porticoccaceae bacterium]